MKFNAFTMLVFLFMITSCTKRTKFVDTFNNINDRVWIGKDFWSIPMEDWKIEEGKLQCIGTFPNSRVNLLTHLLSPGAGEFEASVKISLTKEGNIPGSAGLLVGLHNEEDSDVRSLCYFGKGVNAGVSLQGFAYLKDERIELPEDFSFNDITIFISGNNNKLKMKVVDKKGVGPKELSCNVDGIQGLVALVNNPDLGGNENPGNSTFSFDDLSFSGSKVVVQPDNTFGPVLWTMYTLSKKTVKIMALLPPIGKNDNQNVSLQLKNGEDWENVATESIGPDSRTAVFKLLNWDDRKDVQYRVEYIERGKDGTETPEYYQGTIRKDPVDRPLKFGGLTCQQGRGFPYTPLVENLTTLNPDILYFSGDQIYENNGGYGVKREPVDVSILSYLGTYYMFGWAFGDIMRDRPTICTPDDHDIFHGNIWGEGGETLDKGATTDKAGFIQSTKMLNVVNSTQCGQLPDPYDPTPLKNGMSVWYTDLTYGRISFAIISDRYFKSAPDRVAYWGGRLDHLPEPPKDLSVLDKPGELVMIGERQTRFLNDWIMDWNEADIKVLLSQTVFANAATHHGSRTNFLYGDLDSGGWPKSARDEVIKLLRKVAAIHINGDQHLSTLVQYGLDNFRDASWSFCTPAISVGYQRWFLPDEIDIPTIDRPEHGYPNTGKYTDGFGNKNYVYAVGNPGEITGDNISRYNLALLKASGFGMITFDQIERTIHMDAWRFKAKVSEPNYIRDQFPGWPHKISQFDNLGMGAENILPLISVNKANQLMQIWNEETGELMQIYRIKGNEVQPRLHEGGTYRVIIGENIRKEFTGLNSQINVNEEKVFVEI